MTQRQAPSGTVIVTGATGFVGQHVVARLLEQGHDVVVMARDPARASAFPWFDRVRVETQDIHASPGAYRPAEGATLVHLAWPGLPDYRGMFHLEDNLPNAYRFLRHMIGSGIQRVLVVGTCLEYGMQYGPLPASTPTRPSTPYGLAKDTLRRQLELLRAQLPFSLQWARLFYMHGPGQNPRSILAQLDAAMDRGDPVFDMSGGEQLRDYLPVEQVAAQLCQLVSSGEAGTYNVCSGRPISVRTLVEQRIAEKGSAIKMNLGHWPYPDYEPMAFWGTRDVN